MPSSHLILCCPLLLLPPTPPSISVFSNESTLRMMWPKYWSFSFSITSWQIDGGTMETVTGFIFLGSKITADGDYSHEIKRCLLFGRKDMTNLDSIFTSRNITILTKVHMVKVMVFPVVMDREAWCASVHGVKDSWT